MLRSPGLDAVLQVGCHKSGVEGENHLPGPAGHALIQKDQSEVVLLVCQFLINWNSKGVAM